MPKMSDSRTESSDTSIESRDAAIETRLKGKKRRRKRYISLNPDSLEKCLEMYRGGTKVDDIATYAGQSKSNIHRIIQRYVANEIDYKEEVPLLQKRGPKPIENKALNTKIKEIVDGDNSL